MTVQKLLHWRMEKLNAEAHIDEIIKTSEDKNKGRPNIPDENNLYGDMAKDGWRYREAYFMDHDGKYYGLTLSVAYGRDGKVAYNIANIKERSFPPDLWLFQSEDWRSRGGKKLLRRILYHRAARKAIPRRKMQMCMHTCRERRTMTW